MDMGRRRSVESPLALTVLALLAERPMHPYEIGTVIRERGIEYSVRLNYGSLYSVVDALREAELIVSHATVKEGRRPERTVYAITETGRAELESRLQDLLGSMEREYPRFAAGLSFITRLREDEAVTLLRRRAWDTHHAAEAMQTTVRGLLEERGLPRHAIVEVEYQIARMRADAEWTRNLADDIESGDVTWTTPHDTHDGERHQ